MEFGEPSIEPAQSEATNTAPSLAVEFASESVRCGDDVRVQARSVAIANGTSVTFRIRQRGREITSLNGQIRAGSARATWRSQAQTDERPEPAFEVAAEGGGQTASGTRALQLRKYDDVPTETKTFARSTNGFAWTGKFTIRLDRGQIVVTTKIKLLNREGPKPADGQPLPAIGSPVSDADKQTMKSDIEGKLSNKHFFHRDRCRRANSCSCPRQRGCCKIRVRVVVQFVESGEHHRVNLFQGPGQANSGNWTRVKTRANSYAHETGHLLGWYDEYSGGATGPGPRWQVQSGVVMATGLRVPAEYYWDFRDWLRSKVGEVWTVMDV